MPEHTHLPIFSKRLEEHIRELAPSATLIRVFPRQAGITYFYASDYCRISVQREAENEAARLIRSWFSHAADWRRAHDFHIPTGGLYRTPEPFQRGYIPEDDQSFGMTPHRHITTAMDGMR